MMGRLVASWILSPPIVSETNLIVKAIQKNDFLSRLDDEQTAMMVDLLVVSSFKPGEDIIKEGSEGDSMYIVAGEDTHENQFSSRSLQVMEGRTYCNHFKIDFFPLFRRWAPCHAGRPGPSHTNHWWRVWGARHPVQLQANSNSYRSALAMINHCDICRYNGIVYICMTHVNPIKSCNRTTIAHLQISEMVQYIRVVNSYTVIINLKRSYNTENTDQLVCFKHANRGELKPHWRVQTGPWLWNSHCCVPFLLSNNGSAESTLSSFLFTLQQRQQCVCGAWSGRPTGQS